MLDQARARYQFAGRRTRYASTLAGTSVLALSLLLLGPIAPPPAFAAQAVIETQTEPEAAEAPEAAEPEEAADAEEELEEIEAQAAEEPPAEPEPRLAALFPDVDLEAFARNIQLYRDRNIAAGDAMRERFEDPVARTLLEYTALRSGGVTDFERIARFMSENPDWPGRHLLRTRAEQALTENRPSDETLLAFFATEKPRTAGGSLMLAEALRREGAVEDANKLVRETWRSESLADTSELRLLLSFPGILTRNDHRIRMERRLFAGDWVTARRAAMLVGDGFDKLVELRQAVMANPSAIQRALAAVPEELRQDSSFLFSKARSLRIAEKWDEAAEVIREAPQSIAVIGDGDGWWTERRIVGRILLENGDAKGAYALVSGHAAQTPAEFLDAEFHAGWIALRFLDEPEKALAHFERGAERATTPISTTRFAYWRGRAYEAMGEAERAREAYEEAAAHPIAFYGQLAHETLGNGGLNLREPEVEDAQEQRRLRDESEIARAIRLLHAIGAQDLGTFLLADLGRTLEDAALLQSFAELAEELENTRGLLALSRNAVNRGLPLDNHAYPVAVIPEFPLLGDAVEPALVYAIARQESAFDPNAVSPAGARGLMQLMPGTARRTAERYGVRYEASRLVGDPVYSAKLGAAHLGELMNDWRGSYALAFAAYNAGPAHARRWIQRFGDPRSPDVDPIDWVEQIPFPETRSYVQRVMENLLVYRERLGVERELSIEADLRAGHVTR